MRRRNQNLDNTWIFWVVAAGFVVYWIAQSNATSAANLNQTGVPPGSRVAGSTVYNAQGQVIGSITAAGYYYPTIGTTGTTTSTTSNPLTGTTVVNFSGSTTPLSQSAMGIHCPAGKQLYDVGDMAPSYVCR